MAAPLTALQQPTPLRKPVSLALQGGGALGAYTWGVLDGLLASRRIAIDQISGTSAGALNGAVLASALATGGRRNGHEQAREALEAFWHTVARPDQAAALAMLWGPFTGPLTDALRSSMGQFMWASGLVSPYSVPSSTNPLRDAIDRHVDVEAIRSAHAPALYVTVTSVRTGLPRVIANADMSIDALSASACLPQLFQAVELDGEPYWDGGFSGNPTLWPLIRHGQAGDVILVQLAADSREETPTDAAAIQRRIGEIMFNASLVAEMQAIAAIRDAAARGNKGAGASPFAAVRMHRIEPPSTALLDQGSADGRSWAWLTLLRDEGRAAARAFLKRHTAALGRHETLDIAKFFQSPQKPRIRVRGALAEKAGA
jgi:NTE family protein